MVANIDTTEDDLVCTFCDKKFIRKASFERHLCTVKQRWLRHEDYNERLAYRLWTEFMTKRVFSNKSYTMMDFVKSQYYGTMLNLSNYCIQSHVLNPIMYLLWLGRNRIPERDWDKDSVYGRYLLEYLRNEDAMTALSRTIETCLEHGQQESLTAGDYLKWGNVNKIIFQITTGRISPWVLYQSGSGLEFLDRIGNEHLEMIFDYINPELWNIKFKRDVEMVETIKKLLTQAGF